MLSRLKPSSILYWLMNSPSTGIIWISSSVTMKLLRPRNRNLVTARAARNAKVSETATVPTVTPRLIQSASKNRPPVSTRR